MARKSSRSPSSSFGFPLAILGILLSITIAVSLNLSSRTTKLSASQNGIRPKFRWEEGPMQLIKTPKHKYGGDDQYTTVATNMALVQNAFSRAFNSIYHQAPHIPPSLHLPFIEYSLAFHSVLMAHINGAIQLSTPRLENLTATPGIMDSVMQEYEACAPHLQAYSDYLTSFLSNPTSASASASSSTFSGTHLQTLLHPLSTPLQSFLTSETHLLYTLPSHLPPNIPPSSLDLLPMITSDGDAAMKNLSITGPLTLVFLNHDRTFEDGMHWRFPPVNPVLHFGVSYGASWWRWELWKFASCGRGQRGRELMFLG